MYLKSICSVVLSWSLLSCGTQQNITKSNNDSQPTAHTNLAQGTPYCNTSNGQFNIYKIENIQLDASKLPSIYETYVLDAAQVDAYMKSFTKGQAFTLTLPTENGCTDFKMQDAGTMSPELQAKYPEIISLRGFDKENNSVDVDYDGTNFKAKINTKTGTYLFEPFVSNGQVYHLLFLIKHSGYPKNKFE